MSRAAVSHRHPNPPHITATQFERIAADLGPSELEKGEVVLLSPAGFEHSGIANTIAFLLTAWARQSGRGRVYSAEAGVITEKTPDTVRGIDVAYYSYQRLPRGSEPSGFCAIAPNLAVEIVGKGQAWKKMLEKAGEYLRMGVDRVWIVDPKKKSVSILRPDDEPTVLTVRHTISDPKILPGFRCRVRDFFA